MYCVSISHHFAAPGGVSLLTAGKQGAKQTQWQDPNHTADNTDSKMNKSWLQ